MRVLFKSLKVGAGALLFAGVVYLLLAAPGLLTDSASTVPVTPSQVARR